MNTCSQTEQPIQSVPAAQTVVPRYQVRETESNFIITAYLPGLDRSSLETTVQEDNIVIKARRTASVVEGWKPLHLESDSRGYRLVIGTDHRVNREAITAGLNQGMLKLTVPKAETLKPRRIEIS